MRYPAINNLMTLVNEVGWFTSFLNKPVRYQSHYLTTVQDYIRSDNVTTTIYNRALKKKHKITLAVPTKKKEDRAKARREGPLLLTSFIKRMLL